MLTILRVLRSRLRALATLDDLPRPRVLDVVLRLALQQLFRRRLEVLLAAVFREDANFGGVTELFFLLLELLMEELALGGVRVEVEVVAAGGGLGCEELELLDCGGVAGPS